MDLDLDFAGIAGIEGFRFACLVGGGNGFVGWMTGERRKAEGEGIVIVSMNDA